MDINPFEILGAKILQQIFSKARQNPQGLNTFDREILKSDGLYTQATFGFDIPCSVNSNAKFSYDCITATSDSK